MIYFNIAEKVLFPVVNSSWSAIACVRCTYTWTFFNCTEAVVASVGNRSTESAASPATAKATVVKKPKTDCMRLRLECIAWMAAV